jgi:transcriptional regulator with XRE-family HTH domain
MKDQISKIMETEGLTPARFADEIGVQRSSISHILSGRNKPSYDFITKILERFQGINAEWLLTGKGSMIKSSASAKEAVFKQKSLFEPTVIQSVDELMNQKQTALSDKKAAEKVIESGDHKNKVNPADVVPGKTTSSGITYVNNIKDIVIFYTDGTFEKYQPR